MCSDAWLAVLQAAGPGTTQLTELVKSLGDAAVVVGLARSELVAAGLDAATIELLRSPDAEKAASWRRWLGEPDRYLVALSDPSYPPLLKELPDAPLALWVVGRRPELLQAPQLAMVGSRNPTQSGRETAEQFARYLSDHGLTITSGLAVGIDGACHRGGLAGLAGTIAVLGSGLDRLYPESHADLASRVATNGLLISEYPPATPPRSFHFPQRNRVIAGMSVGTLVVEAARRSGSLITARLAGEYGREVFAIPGSIHSPLARGCHRLIKDGAKLVEDATDVLVEIASFLQTTDAAETPENEPDADGLTERPGYAELLRAIDFDPCSIADLRERTGLTAAELSSMLLLLELEGFVEALPGGLYSRLPKRSA